MPPVYPDIRLNEFWMALKTRVNSARIQELVRGANRIHLSSDDYPTEEGARPWGRVVITPVVTAFEIMNNPAQPRLLNWLMVAEWSNFEASSLPPNRPLESIHAELYNLLQDWEPVGLTKARISQAVYRWTSPQSLPMFDDARNVWFTSAEYRCNVFPILGA